MTWKKKTILVIFSIILVFFIVDVGYWNLRKKQFLAEAKFYEEILKQEKEWIRKNQGAEGEIYLNNTNANKETGDVNPYFACQAAMGLLSGEVTEDDIQCVTEYLSWHTRRLVESEGEICNYQVKNGILLSTGEYDSVDSYVAVFLTLLCEFVEKGGLLEDIESWQEAVEISFQKLQSLTEDQLTRVSEKKASFYLMDNAEVYEACDRMAHMLESETIPWKNPKERMAFSAAFKKAAEEYRDGIEKNLWNSEEERYEIGLSEGGDYFVFQGWDVLYPDAAAQIYPIACGFSSEETQREEQLYNKFCEQYDWQHLYLSDEFSWPVFAYVASKLKDMESAEIYLHTYNTKYKNNRSYPLHTADSGWTARTCGEVITFLKKEAEKGLWEILIDYMEGIA